MGKHLVGLTRVLLLCALLLALPAVASAQCVSRLMVNRVWTQDASGADKSTFAPGEPIRFAADLNNAYGASMLGANGAQVSIASSFYNDTKRVDIPPGISRWTWNATVPSQQGSNTVTVRAYDHFCGVWVERSASFTIGQSSLPPPPSPQSSLRPGWYHNGAGTIPGVSSILYRDSSGLTIVWGNSYVYPYPGNDPLYWYVEVIYLNLGRQPLPITCSGRAAPSIVKEHMRGTANAGYVAAEETFCSRRPNFTGSLKPGGAHFEWAIFHNVPWRGGEVALEWGPYRFSPWVNPWYSPYLPDVPLPAECPPELVALRTCQPAVQPSQGVPPGFVCLGGRPGEQCNQPPELIRQPIQWSQDPITAIRESPFGPVELNRLLQQHKGLVCGMELLPGVGHLLGAAFTGVAVGADIFTGELHIIDMLPYASCAEVLLERRLLDPTRW